MSNVTYRNDLRTFIHARLSQLGLSLREFAARLGYSGPSPVSEVLGAGKAPARAVPRHRIESWIKALRLDGDQAEYCRELLLLTSADPALQARWTERQRLLSRLREMMSLLDANIVPPSPAGGDLPAFIESLQRENAALRSVNRRLLSQLEEVQRRFPPEAV